MCIHKMCPVFVLYTLETIKVAFCLKLYTVKNKSEWHYTTFNHMFLHAACALNRAIILFTNQEETMIHEYGNHLVTLP